jgi:hypothetical protein
MYAVASSAKVVAPTMRMQNSQTKRVVAKVPVKASSFNAEKVRRSLFCDRFFRDAFYDLRAFVTEARGAFMRRWIRGRWFFFAIIISGARARGGVRAASFLQLIQRH